jgi:hypothetical protein
MKQKVMMCWVAMALCLVCLVPRDGLADEKTLQNTLTAYLGPGTTPREATVTLWMENVNPLIGITLTFKFAPGADTVALDSLVTHTGRAAAFKVVPPLYTRENQTLLVNMLVPLDSTGAKTVPPIAPGQGMLAVLYFSAKGPFPADAFQMVTLQLPPENVLMYVTESVNQVTPTFTLVRKPAPMWPPDAKGK